MAIAPEIRPFIDLVQIRCPETADTKSSFGSGLLVGPGIVLTALHCVSDKERGWAARTGIEVYLWRDLHEGIERGYKAQIAWPKAPLSRPADAAILVLEDHSPPVSLLPPAYCEMPDQEIRVMVRGFPRASAGPSLPGGRIEVNLSGHASIMSASNLRLAFTSRNPSERKGREAWAGLSGGPLLSGPALLGVMRDVPEGWDGTVTLAAEPLSPLLRGEAGEPLRRLLGIAGPLLSWDNVYVSTSARLRQWLLGSLLAILIAISGNSLARAWLGNTGLSIPDFLAIPGILITAFGLYREITGSQHQYDQTYNDRPPVPTTIKIEKGLYGGSFAGLVVGVIISISYYRIDPAKIPFWAATSEIVVFFSFAFGLLGALIEAAISLIGRWKTRRNLIVHNEVIAGIVVGPIVGLLSGPAMGWYFGQYQHERPFAPPTTVLTCSIPGGVIVGFFLVFFRDNILTRVIVRNIFIAFLVSFVVAGLGNAFLDAVDANTLFFNAMYGSGKIYSRLIGGFYYVASIATLVSIHVGACLAIDRVSS